MEASWRQERMEAGLIVVILLQGDDTMMGYQKKRVPKKPDYIECSPY